MLQGDWNRSKSSSSAFGEVKTHLVDAQSASVLSSVAENWNETEPDCEKFNRIPRRLLH
jgi:hypothetical protein